MIEDASVCYAYLILCASVMFPQFLCDGFGLKGLFAIVPVVLVLLSLSFLSAVFNSSPSCDDPD